METLQEHLARIDNREPHAYRFEIYRKQEPFFSEPLGDWVRWLDVNNITPEIESVKSDARSLFGEPVYFIVNALSEEEEIEIYLNAKKIFDASESTNAAS